MGLGERLGFYGPGVRDAVKGSRPVWIHAASVGEILAATGLVEQIKKRFPSRRIVISAFTCTGYEVARRTLARDTVIFFPLDHPWIVKRALLTFDPSLVVFLETEIWPNMLRAAHRRGVPTLLLSGRLSMRSFRKYIWLSWFFRGVLQNFTFMGMQTADDADRAQRLGANPLRTWTARCPPRRGLPRHEACGGTGRAVRAPRRGGTGVGRLCPCGAHRRRCAALRGYRRGTSEIGRSWAPRAQ